VIETTALDGATPIRLNRPPVNALDIELNEAITVDLPMHDRVRVAFDELALSL
jgi:hypothetical protein